MGIRLKVTLFLAVLALGVLAVVGVVSHRFGTQIAIDEAKAKARLLSSYSKSQQLFTKTKQRPLIKRLVEEDRFYPELHSGFAVLRMTADIFHKRQAGSGYSMRQACSDPLLESNRATAAEAKIITRFQQNKDLKSQEGVIKVDGKDTFYSAKTVPVVKKCLRCHGDPDDAPKDIQEIYGTETGFDWKLGDINSALLVYIPLDKALAQAGRNTWRIFGLGALLLLVLLGAVWIYLGRTVFAPIKELTRAVDKISMGEDIDQQLATKRSDEIGALTKAVNRLRVSVVKLMGD